jgi:hypothetical protein
MNPEQPVPAEAPRRPYTAPCLTVHGTVQTLTLNTGGEDSASSVDDA